MKLTPVFIDFETYWSVTHSLTKMNPIVYVMHPDTELISCAIKVGTGQTRVIFWEDQIKAHLATIDWSDKIVIGHNMSGFDAMILAWRCGVRPAMWGCTLAMARPIHALSVGGSLGALVKHYNLGNKDQTALLLTKGRHLTDFNDTEIRAMKEYNAADTDQCAALFHELRKSTTNREMKIIDMTIRMLVELNFKVDEELLLTTLGEEKARKNHNLVQLAHALGLTKAAGVEGLIGLPDEAVLLDVANKLNNTVDDMVAVVKAELSSSPKFAARLISWGVEPPMKPSPADPDKQTYAFAKTDAEYIALQEHENPLVATATRVRLDVKSTILETRIKSFLEVSKVMGKAMPIAKNYYAAHTGRWGGSMGLNQENLPRIPRDKQDNIIPMPSNALRLSLLAPKGKKVVVADLSGIELRVNHYLWKVPYSMKLWNEDPKADLYRAAGAIEYSCLPDDVTGPQRQMEKVKALGLGFGAGDLTFKSVAKTMGRIVLTEDEASVAVRAWRNKHPEIVRGWKTCHAALPAIYQGATMDIDSWGLCRATPEGIVTPVGMIRYPALHQEGNEWWYGKGRNRARIYAGKITENIVQHLARNVMADNMLELKKRTGMWPAHSVHDELIYLVDEALAEPFLGMVQMVMRTPPVWWPELVTWSEGDIADSYGAAK